MNKKTLVEIVGWYGMAAILLGYALTSTQIWEVSNIWYKFLNLSGALGLAVNAYAKKAMPPAALNFVWALVAVVSFLR